MELAVPVELAGAQVAQVAAVEVAAVVEPGE